MLGYVTEDQALKRGFTNHGSYYGLPLYIALEGQSGASVQAKLTWLEPVLSMFSVIEIIIKQIMYPGEELGFQFTLGKEIKKL